MVLGPLFVCKAFSWQARPTINHIYKKSVQFTWRGYFFQVRWRPW